MGRIRRSLVALATAVMILVPAAAAWAALPPSSGCNAVNNPQIDQYNAWYFTDVPFTAGEVITLAASGGGSTTMSIIDEGVLVAQTSVPGSLSYTIPFTGPRTLNWEVDGGNATWVSSCTPASDDTDGDGVIDTLDICPGTVLPDVPTNGLNGAGFAAQFDGSFDSGLDQFDGMYTLDDTLGCSGSQIIDLKHLGNGHTKFGISRGALQAFIAGLGT